MRAGDMVKHEDGRLRLVSATWGGEFIAAAEGDEPISKEGWKHVFECSDAQHRRALETTAMHGDSKRAKWARAALEELRGG